VAEELTKEQKEHLDVCVESVKKEMYSKLKVPLFGLVGVFAVGVSIFATYLYMQAKINVMNAQKEFYEYFTEARDSMDEKLGDLNLKLTEFNELGSRAEQKLNKLSGFVDTLEEIADNYTEMRRSEVTKPVRIESKSNSPAPQNETVPPPLNLNRSGGYSKDMFQVPQQQTLK
jgi:hypothetical protein